MAEAKVSIKYAPEQRRQRVFERANKIWRSGRQSKALAILHAFRRRFPDDPEILKELAFSLNFSGQLREAARLLVEYAKSCQQRGLIGEGIWTAEFALRLDRHNRAEAWAVRGQLLAALGSPEQAWKSLEAAYEAAWKESEPAP
jgi:tetratricopeptide (TPR) repeat protein